MSMMNSTRARTRVGALESFCTCCKVGRGERTNRTQRTREKRAWSVSPEVNENDREWTEDEQVSVFGKVVATF